MKKFNKMIMTALFISILILITANTVYSGMNPPTPGAHWQGPAVLADVTLYDNDSGWIFAEYVVSSCKGVKDVTGTEYYDSYLSDIQSKDDLLYAVANIYECIPDNLYGSLMVSNVISFDESQREEGIITARVLLLNSVTK